MAIEKPQRRLPPGIVERHSRSCASPDSGRCDCAPSIEAWVWSPRDGRKIRRTFTGRGALAAAKGWRRDAASDVGRGKMRAPTSTTIADEAAAWMERAERGEVRGRGGRAYKPSVLRTYRADLTRYVVPALGSIRVSQLRRREVQELLVDELVRRGLSGSRIRGVLNALRAVLRRPLQADELQVDPTNRLDLPANSKPRDRAASPAEAAALLAALPDDDRAVWATAFYAGLRRGELRALRWSDLDETLTEIRVSRGWDEVEGEIAPKSEKGVRRVPIAGVLRRILLEHKARTGRRDGDLVFGRTASAPFTPTNVRERALGAWAATVVGAFFRGEALSIEPIGLHECRHTFVSLMASQGVPLERVGDYVGHSSTYMTDRYRHLLEGQREQDVAALDSLLNSTGAHTGAQPGETALPRGI
jgi:integrase